MISREIYDYFESHKDAFESWNLTEAYMGSEKFPGGTSALTNFIITKLGTNINTLMEKMGQAIPQGFAENLDNIRAIKIPANIRELKQDAFANCKNLKSVVFEEGCKVIRSSFNGCENLMRVSLPDSLVGIGRNAFMGCNNLTQIVVPQKVQHIDTDAFPDNETCDIIVPGNPTIPQAYKQKLIDEDRWK